MRLNDDWHGVTNLPLSGTIRLTIRMKKEGAGTLCRVNVSGQAATLRALVIRRVNTQTGARDEIKRITLDKEGEASAALEQPSGVRYLWSLE